MSTKTLKLNRINTAKFCGVLSISVALVFSVYIALIIKTTVNITVYKDLEAKIVELDSKLGDLEFDYMALKKDLDLNKAESLGYFETQKITFVDRASVDKTLSLLNLNN